jgi:hypothetical protein
MATLNETIAENIAAARKFFSDREFPTMATLYAQVADNALLFSFRASAAAKIATQYEWIAQRTYNGQERAQGLAQSDTWNLIASRLRATQA